MVIFLQEDHELPLIDGSHRIRGGSRHEPAAKVGLVDLYGEVWRTGGTKTQTGDQMDDFLEAAPPRSKPAAVPTPPPLAGLPQGRLRRRFQACSSTCCSNPEFRADKLDLAKKPDDRWHLAPQRRRRRHRPREAIKLAYGNDNPYARHAGIRDRRRGQARRPGQLAQDNTSIPTTSSSASVGDFDSAAMEAKLRQAFGILAERSGCAETPKFNSILPSPATTWSQRRREPESTFAWSARAPTATILTTSPSKFSTKSWVAASLRACSGHPHQARPGLLRGRRHRHRL